MMRIYHFNLAKSFGGGEAHGVPGHYGRVGGPIVDAEDLTVTACTKTGFPLDDFPDGVALTLHRPHHGNGSTSMRD